MLPKRSKAFAYHTLSDATVGLAERARAALSLLKPRRRDVIERLHGLWDGRIRTPSQVAIELGTSRSNCGLIRDRAYARIARDLDSGSLCFAQELRTAYIRLLASDFGMALQGEWNDQRSFLFRNNQEDCLAVSFLCRASRIEPESLGVTSEDGLCFDSLRTKNRYDGVVSTMVEALTAYGRPLPLDGLLKDLGAEINEGFLRRCLQLSPQCGLDESKMASLRSWSFFDSKGLTELAHRALLELGGPSSTREILGMIERLFPGRRLRLESIIRVLAEHPERFMLVGYRLHGLRAWGLERVPTRADFLFAELQRRGGRAISSELYAEGRRLYGFQSSSLFQALKLHPKRFRQRLGRIWEIIPASSGTHS